MTEKLLPTLFENGVNTMFPIEIGTWGDQFEPARKKYGNGMLGVGGMDKTALRKDKAAEPLEQQPLTRLAFLADSSHAPTTDLCPEQSLSLCSITPKK